MMLDRNFRNSNSRANRKISYNYVKLLLAVMAFILGLINLIAYPIIGVVVTLISVWRFFRFYQVSKATDLIRDYGPLFINHPEFYVTDYTKALKRDRDTVIKEIEFMLKNKVLFGKVIEEENRFKMDEDFNLRGLLQKNGWANALFVTEI